MFLGTSWYSADPAKHAQITGSRASHARTRVNIEEAIRQRPVQEVGRAAYDGSGEDLAELCGNCGLDRAAILPDGQLTPCAIGRWLDCGNVRDIPLADLLSSPAWRHTLTVVPRYVDVRACAPDSCPPASDGNDCPPASCR